MLGCRNHLGLLSEDLDPDTGELWGNFSPDIFDGRADQFGHDAEQELERSLLSRLVVVSNRVAKATDGKGRAGGLAVALQDALKKQGGIWFGWSGSVVAKQPDKPEIVQAGPVTYATLDLTRKQYNEYYNGFANRTLWPLFHYRLDLAAFSHQNYSAYREVNTLFASKLKPLLRNDDLIWVHDYHLIPLGEELRRAGVEHPMGFFLHTPFPAMEVMTVLPSNLDLIRALCAYDVVGFQTENDLRAFLDYIVNEAGGGIMGDHLVHAFGKTLWVEIFPIGIDVEELERTAQEVGRAKSSRRLRNSPKQPHVDRRRRPPGLQQGAGSALSIVRTVPRIPARPIGAPSPSYRSHRPRAQKLSNTATFATRSKPRPGASTAVSASSTGSPSTISRRATRETSWWAFSS